MCGIAGFSGIKGLTSNLSRIATNKMKILGLYNQSRGTHGCGLYINGEIYKGVEDFQSKKNTKEFDDFISDKDFIWPELDLAKGNVMILHTRQATAGAHVEANTHPFRIKSAKPNGDLVGVHNGTIENIWTGLCKTHGLDHAAEHIHVDSKALYTLIDRVGLQILEEYKGYAALVWAKPSESNALYVYHGAARKDRSSEDVWEERPMWFLRAAEGMYFSSLECSLNAIRESKKQEVELLDYNTVFKVVNGKFTNETVSVNRKDANLAPIYIPPVRVSVPSRQACRVKPGEAGFAGHTHRHTRALAEESSRNNRLRNVRDERGGKASDDLKTPSTSIVWREAAHAPTLATASKDTVRFYQGRYRRAVNKLCDALLWIKDRGIIGEEGEDGAKAYWFWQGVMLRDKDAYEAMVEQSKLPSSWVYLLTSNWAYAISVYSNHPVTNLESEAVDADNFFRFSWYYDLRRVKIAQFRPEWSGRCYTISNGLCIKIIPSSADDKVYLPGASPVDQGELTFIEGVPPHMPVPLTGKHRNSEGVLIDYDKCCSQESVTKSIFDVIYEDVNDFTNVASKLHTRAMEEFVCDNIKAQWSGLIPTEQEVQNELWQCVRTAVAAFRTIREGLNDTDNVLEEYMKILVAAGETDDSIQTVDAIDAMIQESGERVPNIMDRMAFYDKHGYWPEESRTSPRRRKTPLVPAVIPDNLPWSIAEDGGVRVLNQDNDDESLHDGHFMDAALEEDRLRHMAETADFHVVDEEDEHHRHHSEAGAERRDAAATAYWAEKEAEIEREVNKKMYDLVSAMHEMNGIADDLQGKDDSDYAQDAANIIYKSVEHLKHELGEVCEVHHQPEIIMKINQIVAG